MIGLPGVGARRPVVLALVDLVQDVDVLLPVLSRVQAEPKLRLRTLVSRWLLRESPRTAAAMTRAGLPFRTVRRNALKAGEAPSLRGVDAVLLASESSAPAHAAGHALARRAAEAGVRAYALQHGLELSAPGEPRPRLASPVMLCWGPEGESQATAAGATSVVVGRALSPWPAPPPTYDVGVFENLHWSRYDAADRDRFISGLLGLAEARPHLRLLVRSHPAGGWLDGFAAQLAGRANLTLEPAELSRSSVAPGWTAAASARRVITTPSTVALDAVSAGRPVALAVEGGAPYRPLPVLHRLADWIAFAEAPARTGGAEADFLARHLAGGDAAASIVACLLSDLSAGEPSCEKRA